MLTTEGILEKLVSLNTIEVSDLGTAVLQPEKSDRFVQVIADSSALLGDARELPMAAASRDIDRIEFAGEILHVPSDTLAADDPTFASNRLTAIEVMSVVAIKDDTMEENIERDNFESTLITMWGEAIAARLQRWFILADTGSGDPLLALNDGWSKLSGNEVTGVADADFTATDIESMFNAMLAALPVKYFSQSDMSGWRFYVTFNMLQDYWDVLRARGTTLGDVMQTGNAANIAFKGIPVRHTFGLAAGTAILSLPSNLVWGVRRDIRIEPDRHPKKRETEWIMTLRMDCNFEDENAVVNSVGYTG